MSTVLIIGAGPNIGQACAETFYNAGYEVAVASRTQKLDSKFRFFDFDASRPDTVPALFERVSAELEAPSVVIYNTYAPGSTDPARPFVDLDQVQREFNINTISLYAVAYESVKWFDTLGPGSNGGTFIFTGNAMNVGAIVGHMAFGMGKSAGAHMIKHLALATFNDKPHKFYYADERHEDGLYMMGGPGGDLGGESHAEAYLELAKDPKQRPWDYTFVKGKGYVEFPRMDLLPVPIYPE